MHKGFYLKELRVVGRAVEPAKISLEKGMNILQGASNTGKSYVFNCINYVLGSSKEPDDIAEAEGYDEIRLTLCTYDGFVYTLSRQFGDAKIYVAATGMDKFDKASTQQLDARHSSDTDSNISCFLLRLIGLQGKKLSVNKRNEKREISFRDLAKICLINEELIITKHSPIYSGEVVNKTVEESAFKLILSGKDDDELESVEDPRIYKSKIKGKLELIESSIVRNNKQLSELNKKVRNIEIEEINVMIDEFTSLINNSHKNVAEEEIRRAGVWKELETLRNQITQIEELENRFNLLNRHYDSDLSRLEFINEGKQYIDQLKNVNCPICGTMIQQSVIENYEQDNSEKVIDSLAAEAVNIKLKQKELIQTLEHLNNEKQELNAQYSDKKELFNRIDTYINNKLKPIADINHKKLEEYIGLKEDKSRISMINEEINTLLKEKEYYSTKLDEKSKDVAGRVVANEYYNTFSDEIKTLLNEWGISCESVYYDKTENDIEIDGKPRKTFGKGFRAIYESAFMIALMQYCRANNNHHPYFLVLDSPLTSYKEQDMLPADKKEKIPEDIQKLFYKSLSRYTKDSDIQLFILENKDPEPGIKRTVNYEHFSRNIKVGRYGFFPARRNKGTKTT